MNLQSCICPKEKTSLYISVTIQERSNATKGQITQSNMASHPYMSGGVPQPRFPSHGQPGGPMRNYGGGGYPVSPLYSNIFKCLVI